MYIIQYDMYTLYTSKTLLVTYTVYVHKLCPIDNTTSTGILVVLLQSNAACLL